MNAFNILRKAVKGSAYILVYGIAFGILILFAGLVLLGVQSVFSLLF